ncbi:MAG: aminotransferase class I/II-fold pyridoxal phosphate-dependent enzyme [Gemmatimonadetes bacterium]|nr:aminotransferase class I/II-fold pyridoxal phosphate-dependent enzyme [Gemmatimonadota bacterium]
MTPFPRRDYGALTRYHFDRTPVDLDLSDNTNRWGTPPAALAVLRGADADLLARYPDIYADGLRATAAARLGIPEACVATGCGSDDVLDSTFRACGGAPSDFVAMAAPTFSMVGPFAQMNGMPARAVPWADALDDPARLLDGGPALVYVCRPNNPTGEVAPTSWVEALLEAAGESGPVVVLDEAYVDFGGDTFAARAAAHPRLVVSRTLSKAFGLAGLRVGYAVAEPATALEIEKSRGPYKGSRVAGEAAAAALRDADGWVARTVAECVANRERAFTELARRGLDPVPSQANFILFRAPTGAAATDALALRARGVAVRPFPGDMPDGADALRVTVAPWAEMERFLAAMDAYLDALPARVATPGVRP